MIEVYPKELVSSLIFIVDIINVMSHSKLKRSADSAYIKVNKRKYNFKPWSQK